MRVRAESYESSRRRLPDASWTVGEASDLVGTSYSHGGEQELSQADLRQHWDRAMAGGPG